MATATLEKCDICGKMCRSVKRHKEASHQETASQEKKAAKYRDEWEHPMVIELKTKVAELKEQLARVKQPGKSVGEIARILYDDVARSICDSNGISLGEWEGIDQNDYLKVARRIKG